MTEGSESTATRRSTSILRPLYLCSIALGICSVVLAAFHAPLSLVPMGIGVAILAFAGRGDFAREWAPRCFLVMLPLIAAAIAIRLSAA